jgi:Type I restriction enzyme R protein N terminus (HSDR_N)
MSFQKQLYCPIRKEWVAELPEEIVRQSVLQRMMHHLGFPPSLIAVEKALRHMPHIVSKDLKNVPDRRADVVCFGKGIHLSFDLYPLLVVECKAIPLTPKVIHQVAGYNHFIKAYFIAIANQTEILTGWRDQRKQNYTFIHYLPTYANLIEAVIGRVKLSNNPLAEVSSE